MSNPLEQNEAADQAGAIAGDERSTNDDWTEETCRQARALNARPASEQAIFCEFRRKIAAGEAISRAFGKLLEALRFSGRITITFHQGKLTKSVLEEAYFRGRAM